MLKKTGHIYPRKTENQGLRSQQFLDYHESVQIELL